MSRFVLRFIDTRGNLDAMQHFRRKLVDVTQVIYNL